MTGSVERFARLWVELRSFTWWEASAGRVKGTAQDGFEGVSYNAGLAKM